MSPECGTVEQEPGAVVQAEVLREFGKGLHDLCQPLTTLQCRLYLGSTEDNSEVLREVIAHCLHDCEQVITSVNQLQGRLGELRSETGDAR